MGDLVRYKLEEDFVGIIGGFDFSRESDRLPVGIENQESVHVFWQKPVTEPHLGQISEWYMCPADLQIYKNGRWCDIVECEVLNARMREELKRV